MPQLTDKTIKVLQIKYLDGPSMWTYDPIIEAWVDIGDLEDYPSNKIPGFYERLCKKVPSLVEHRCSYEERGGFLKRVEEGTWPCHILEHLTLEIQNLAGMPGGFGKARETTQRGVYKVVVSAWHKDVTIAALNEARELLLALIQDREFDLDASIEMLHEMTDDLFLGPSTGCIVQAADDRRIPAIRLTSGNLVQLGYGAKQRRIWTAETDRTSAIAESISRDKDLTKSLLSAAGVPTPEGQLVDSVEEAWEVAQDLGLPVVVKPQDGNHGRGVFTNLSTQSEIQAAYAVAVEEGSGVLVEKFIFGDEHRLLVVGQKVVAAAKGEAAWVTGDGQQTVHQLIGSQLNSDPRRGSTEDFPLNPVRIDSSVRLELSRQQLTADSIPKTGQKVLVQTTGNVSIDVTDLIHPQVAKKVALAARVVGLEIAGIDLVAQDISKPLEDQGGAIVEVNAGPGLLMHLKPSQGKSRPVGRAIVDHLFPSDVDYTIPIVGISGTKGKTSVAKIAAHFLRLNNSFVGLACSDGLYFQNKQVEKTDAAHWKGARRTLVHRGVEAAVIENSADVILNQGLAYNRCKVGVLTNIDPTIFMPESAIVEEKHLFNVYRTQVDVVLSNGSTVLNAQDPMIVEISELSDGEVIFFSLDAAHPVIEKHLAKGGKVVVANATEIILKAGMEEVWRIQKSASAYIRGDVSDHRIANTLAAIGVAWALHLPYELIDAGIETFSPDRLEV
jgi:cyanophycin synthetase